MSEKPPNLPPNRKSCFQITNVQEAASTESLDDPDESQTEGANNSQADLGVCDQSLSEGTLNNVGEQQEGQPALIGPVNRGVSVNSGGGVPVPPARQPSIPSLTPTTVNWVPSGTVPARVPQANPVATGTMSATTCSSRFRKVKVPSCFLRGRWKCTEFYGRDSDNMDYSRLGVTGGSVVISAGSADSGQSGASALQPIGCSTALPQHPQHAQVNIPQTHPSSLNGDGASNGAMLTGGYPDHQQQQFAPLQPQDSNTQNLPMAPPSVGPPDCQEPSPVITPVVPGAQGQGMMAHSGGEVASASGAHGGTPARLPVSISSQAEDRRRKSDVPQPSPGTLSGNVGMDSKGLWFPDSLFGHAIAEKINQVMDVVKSNLMYAIREEMLKAKITELSKRNLELESENSILKSLANTDQLSQLPPSQGTTPDITPVGPESQGMSMVTQGGEAASVQAVILPVGSGTSIGSVPLIPSAPATITIHSGVQNVTATVPPSNILTPPDMLGQTTSAAGLIHAQGAHRGVPLGLSAALSILAEDSRQTSDFLPQPTTDALLKKDGRKPFLSESLGPPNPTVESIPIDGEEASTSDASVVAIDNKIEQALDLVKNHLTYAVREEIELLKEKIKEQYEKNSSLEHENTLLKSLVKTDQLDQAQGRDTASSQEPMLQVGSGASMDSVLLGIPPATTTTTHSSVQNVTSTVSSTTKPPPGILGQPQSAGGLVQAPGAHGGAPVGLPVGISSQAEDSRQRSDFLPQPSIDALREKDGIKPVISENIIPPTVDSLFNIPIDEGSASHASVVAIDNKIEQALDLVKSHLMNAVQEEVEVLKEQIKEQYGRNSVLDHENTVLKSLLNTDQLSQLSTQISPMVRTSPSQQQLHPSATATNNTSNDPLVQHEGGMSGSHPDYQQQQFGPVQPQGSKTQNLPMASLSGRPTDTQGSSPVITPGAQGLGKEAQGGEAASAQVLGSVGASTCSVPPGVPSTSAVTPATVPSPTNTPPGVLSQAPSSGGLVQAKGACGGSLVGLSVDVSSQAEDSRQRTSAVIAEPSTDNLSVNKDGIKPFISESHSQFGIPFPFDKKVEQAMDLVKSHLMYAVQEEMELLKEQIKEQSKRNSVLERENTLLKSLANTDQLSQLSSQISPGHHHPATTINNTSVPLAQHDQEQTSPPTSPTSHRHDPSPPPQ